MDCEACNGIGWILPERDHIDSEDPLSAWMRLLGETAEEFGINRNTFFNAHARKMAEREEIKQRQAEDIWFHEIANAKATPSEYCAAFEDAARFTPNASCQDAILASKIMTPWVYFITADNSKTAPIKIGISDRPYERFKALQSSSPVELKVLALCYPRNGNARALESVLHSRFQPFRVYGEWFQRNRQLASFINNLPVRINLSFSDYFQLYVDKEAKYR